MNAQEMETYWIGALLELTEELQTLLQNPKNNDRYWREQVDKLVEEIGTYRW